MKTIGKFFFKLIRFAVIVYGILFAVFYFDLDGKFLYYIWEPFMIKRFDNMKRADTLKTPYTMKDNVE
ncbi:MAG: hypothetical protein E7305_10390 [Butyrivibrio sp.]|jgi:hypothetical protein|nr:hypothetical protein [Butyrivibrio sp.]